MRQTILITTCACALLMLFGPLYGQNTLFVSYDSTNWVFPTQVGPNDTIAYTLRVSHNLATAYTGPFEITLRANGGAPFTLYSDSLETIPAGSMGKQYSLSDSIDLSRYGGGINIVVVWPTAPNFVTVDTAYGEFTVTDVSVPEAIREIYHLDVYPNPSSGILNLQASFATRQVTELLLSDVQGRILRREKGLPRQISLEGLPASIYFIEVRLKNGQSLKYKVLRSH